MLSAVQHFFMPKTKEQKKKILTDLKEKIDKQKSAVFVSVKGLKAQDIFGLRRKLKEADCLLTITKKTLLDIVLRGKKFGIEPKKLEGELALIFGFKEEISPAKIAYQFSLTNDKLKILGGIFEKEFIGAQQIVALAQIPSKEELLAKVVATISSPISGFVNILQANIKGLIYLLSKVKS